MLNIFTLFNLKNLNNPIILASDSRHLNKYFANY